MSDTQCMQYNEYGGQILCKLQDASLGLKLPSSFEPGMPGPEVMARVVSLKEFLGEARASSPHHSQCL